MTVDMIWVGRLGAASIAGVGVAGIVVMLLMSARWGLGAGTRAMIARFMGSGDAKGANHISQQAFVLSGLYAVIVATLGVIFSEELLILFGLEPEVVSEGSAYLRIQFIGSAAMSFWMMGEAIMQASGDAVNPMKVTIWARVVHLILDPFLIFGWWIFPRMGVRGAATTNLIAYCIGMGITLWYLFSGRSRLKLSMRKFQFDVSILWRIVKIGIPASIMGIQRSFGNLMLMWFMVPFGTLAVAAHTLCQRVEMFLFMPSMGLGMAAGVLVGQNLGAGHPERAEKSGWQATALIEVFMITCSLLILIFAESIISIFTPEPDLVSIGSVFLRIAVTGYMVLGLYSVLQQCLAGAGDTVSPMVVSLLMVWGIQLPLAFLLPKVTNLDVYGVRWAIVAGMLVASVIYVIYFRGGRWKRKRV
ncbi:MATE family efflux transporter [Chloroflexota bacterium]